MTRSTIREGVDHSDPRDRERVGSVLDEKWTLERILGSGGMGAVYAARHRNGARAAVKVLHPELGRRSDIRERFLREGYAANRVEHRGAVQVLDDDIVKEGPDEGIAYLVMEILEGESLEERMERGPPLTEPELLPILNDVLAVLEAAHDHGVIHRDLKPANLFLNKDPAGPGVKVLDFGLARLEEARSVTGVGLALGTPSFMAPEQANGKTTEIDARTDLFAVGATAFMILAGRGVHQADGVLELVARMGTLPAPKLRTVAPHVGEGIAKIIDRALEFERGARYPSAAAMRADVQAALTALHPGGTEDLTDAPPTSRRKGTARVRAVTGVTATSERSVPSRPRSRAPMMLALFVVAGLVLVFVPQARDRAGMPNALGELLAQHRDGEAANVDASASLDGAAALSLAALPPVGSPSESASAASPAVSDIDDASTTELGPIFESLDASADDDGGDAAADDDDDDDDDEADASDVAPIIVGRGTAAPSPVAAAGRPPAVKRPPPKPNRVKRVRPPGKRHRRRHR